MATTVSEVSNAMKDAFRYSSIHLAVDARRDINRQFYNGDHLTVPLLTSPKIKKRYEAEILGLKNIVAGAHHSPFWTTKPEEAPMNHDYPGISAAYPGHKEGELLSPKKLRKQADAIEKAERKAKKAAKARAKAQRKARAVRAENREVARAALIRIAGDQFGGNASVEAAKALLEL